MVAAAQFLGGDGVALLARLQDLAAQRLFVGDGEVGHDLGLELVEPAVQNLVGQLAQDGAAGRGVEGRAAEPDGGRQHVGPAVQGMGDHDDVVAVEDGGKARLLGAVADALAGRLDDGRDHVRAEIGRRQLHDARRQPVGAAVACRHAEAGERVERAPHAGLGQVGGARDVAQRHVALLAPERPDDPQAARKGLEEIRPVAARQPPLRIFRPQSRHLRPPNRVRVSAPRHCRRRPAG